MDFLTGIQSRFSCRRFSSEPVGRELLQQLLKAGAQAPSACNSQRWKFIAVDSPDKRQLLLDCIRENEHKINRFAPDVPAFIVVVKQPLHQPSAMQKELLGENLDAWWDFDMGIATHNICLTATALGLGSVIMGWFEEAPLKKALEIPADCAIPAVIAIGHPSTLGKYRQTPRRPIEESIGYNTYESL